MFGGITGLGLGLGSAATVVGDPYTIPHPSKLASQPQTTAANSLQQKQQSSFSYYEESDSPDFATFLIESYMLSVVSSPLVVAETLAEVQFQPKSALAEVQV